MEILNICLLLWAMILLVWSQYMKSRQCWLMRAVVFALLTGVMLLAGSSAAFGKWYYLFLAGALFGGLSVIICLCKVWSLKKFKYRKK